MKKIVLAGLMFFAVTIVFGQNAYQMKKIDFFVDEAVKEFSLDKKQTKQLHKKRVDYFNDYIAVIKKAKKGELNDEEKKEQLKAVNQTFNKYFSALTGKTRRELGTFLKRIKEETKKI